MSKAFHRYALNYINALNYLETLRRQQEFSDFEKVTHSLVSFLSVFDRVPAGAKGPKAVLKGQNIEFGTQRAP